MKSKAMLFGCGVMLCGLAAWGADRAKLELVGEWPGYERGWFAEITIRGDYAYCAMREGGLGILDIGDPATPQWEGGCDTPGIAWAVAVSGAYAFVADRHAGL